MTKLHEIRSEEAMDNYRHSLGERLGWALYRSLMSFSPSHEVRHDPEAGPVIIVADEVFEVDEGDQVFPSDEEAREAFWSGKY